MKSSAPEVLFVDLNNFARYPTVGVGYLVAALRARELDVQLFSPLAVGVEGMTREPRARPWSLLDQRLRYRSAISGSKAVRLARRWWADRRLPTHRDHSAKLLAAFREELEQKPRVILISAYLMYFDVCRDICAEASQQGIPVVIGGAYFSQPSVARAWVEIPGVTAIVAGEAEPTVADLVTAIIEGKRIEDLQGVWTANGEEPPNPPPLRNLDVLAFPDYSDFPWERYPDRIVPMITGRGCGWGACSFCSDVTSSMGRTYRSRSTENVLEEVAYQAKRHAASKFIFVDLKLNSDLQVWNGLIDGIRSRVPRAQWACAVHVGLEEDNGLSPDRLKAARAAGLVRLTTGFESGSQRLLDSMKKGTSVEKTAQFLRDASAADISVRMTMIVGYPNETASDLLETARFLRAHGHLIERVSLNRLALIQGTPLSSQIEQHPERQPELMDFHADDRMASIAYRNRGMESRENVRAVEEVLSAVHDINRRPVREGARAFEGVM